MTDHLPSLDTPAFVVPEANLVPVSAHLGEMAPIPPSRMFLINKSLKTLPRQTTRGKSLRCVSRGWGGQFAGSSKRNLRTSSSNAARARHRL